MTFLDEDSVSVERLDEDVVRRVTVKLEYDGAKSRVSTMCCTDESRVEARSERDRNGKTLRDGCRKGRKECEKRRLTGCLSRF